MTALIPNTYLQLIKPLTSVMSTGYPWLLMMGMVLPLQHQSQQELPLESVLQQDPVTIQVEQI